MHVAFIGVGNMGRPMLANLLQKGFTATAYDIVPAALDSAMGRGAAEDFAEAKPALDAMGANIIHVGAVGAGEVAKLCNNLIAGAAFVAVSEAFRIAEGYGVDPKVLTQVISKSSGATWVMEKNHPV